MKQGHGLLFETTGNLLPPSIEIDYSKPLKIADIGTGTGDWLSQVEQILPPGSKLCGFDITNTQFQKVPEGSTVSFQIQNMLLPFPDAELAQYDVVHARLLMYAFKSAEWVKVTSNLSTLLKPGGYLFWEDTNYDLWSCVPATIAWTRFIIIDQRASLAAGRDLLFISKLGRYFSEAGLRDIVESIHSTFDLEEQKRKKCSELMLRLHEQSSKGAVERGGVEGLRTIQDAESLVEAVKKETENGAEIGVCLRRVIGRKPRSAEKARIN